MVSVSPHLSPVELERRYKSERQRVARSHFHVIWLLSLSHEIVVVAEVLGFSTRWVSRLLRRYNQGGPEALDVQSRSVVESVYLILYFGRSYGTGTSRQRHDNARRPSGNTAIESYGQRHSPALRA